MGASTMKSTARKHTKGSNDPFAFFQKMTYQAFQFLVTRYGFRQTETLVHPPECVVKYQNETTGITVSYEWGSEIWVTLSRLVRVGAEAQEAEGYGLDVLIEASCSGGITPVGPVSGAWKAEDIQRILQRYADALQNYGSDVLKGDFGVFTRLKQFSEEKVRQRNMELFGSETGET
jgi:hypothetical protein